MITPSPASTSKTACCSKVGMKRGPWTPEEDELLANHVKREGEGRWRTLPKRAGLLRCGKSCRLRWVNYLRPSVKRGHITPDEEDLILRLHRLLGNRWALIAGRIPGRTDNEIKNYWNTHLSKKLIRQGIDPRTHKPLDPNPSPNPNPNHNHNPKPNSSRNVEYSTAAIPNPNFVGKKAEQAGGHHPTSINSTTGAENSRMIANSDQHPNTIDRERIDQGCQRYGGLMMEVQSEHGNEEIDMGYANDDTFSSFLNSLINEDVLANQHQQHPSLLGTASSSQSVMQNFNREAFWGAQPTSTSTLASLVDEQNGLNQHLA